MRYFWVIDQQREGLINVRWKPGHINLANYFTKHFFAPYHQKVRPIYLHREDSPKYIGNIPNPKNFEPERYDLQGCAKTPRGHYLVNYVDKQDSPRIPKNIS